jgi:hypothetical protein
MNDTIHCCVECGSPATKIISDNFKTIFRMEQVYFACGAVQTNSYVDRWKACKVLHEGCHATDR